MIRAVLDTNIVVSALLQPLGPSAQVLVMVLDGSILLCVSGSIYAEYEEVVGRPHFKLSRDVITAALDAIRKKGLWVRPTESIRSCSDPDDDVFLECAQAAQADYLVTGNVKHFPASWGGTRVVTARWLVDNYSPETS